MKQINTESVFGFFGSVKLGLLMTVFGLFMTVFGFLNSGGFKPEVSVLGSVMADKTGFQFTPDREVITPHWWGLWKTKSVVPGKPTVTTRERMSWGLTWMALGLLHLAVFLPAALSRAVVSLSPVEEQVVTRTPVTPAAPQAPANHQGAQPAAPKPAPIKDLKDLTLPKPQPA